MITIVDLEKKHLEEIDMRDHEASLDLNIDALFDEMIFGKTAMWDGQILTCWGVCKEGSWWQIPSKNIEKVPNGYAKKAYKVIKEMTKFFPNAYTLCLKDELHERWMKFIGFKPIKTESATYINGKEYVAYEVDHGD